MENEIYMGDVMGKTMTVVQCWDDGVTTDERLIDNLHRHGAKATFNLNIGLHETKRQPGWQHEGTEVQRLALPELKDVYDGFTIANHSLTHPRLELIPIETARREITEGRERLQQYFQQPIRGFAYPYGTYNEEVMLATIEAGHLYARTTKNVEISFPPANPAIFHPCCHFLDPSFWERYENAKGSGVFYFWGHSYEMISESMWSHFASMVQCISADPETCWGDVPDLFIQPTQEKHEKE